MRVPFRLTGAVLVFLLAVAPVLAAMARADDDDRRERHDRRERAEQPPDRAERGQGGRQRQEWVEQHGERPAQPRGERPAEGGRLFQRAEQFLPRTRAGSDADRRHYYEERRREFREGRRPYHPPAFHPHGYRITALPEFYLRVVLGDFTFFYWDGMFFEPRGGVYIAVGAPIGARVAYLPAGYVSFYIGPARYFFVNRTYYWWDPFYLEYVVVEKPAGADRAMKRGEGGTDELYVYPAQGQSEEQRRQDRFECHEWAVAETGFDPTLADPDSSGRGDYRRALTACLEGRGYTVR